MKKYVILIFVSLLLSTCTYDIYSPNACFNEDVLPIFISNCTYSGCHNAKDKESGYNLTNYDGIMKGISPKHPLQSELYNVIRGSNPSMPPSPYSKLSDKDLNTIKDWIKMGARNTSNCKICDTTSFTYNSRVKIVLQSWCVGCHSSGNAGGGYDLSDYNGVVAAITNNRFLGSIKHQSGFSAMPKNSNQLSQCDLTAIEKWVASGYPNN